jgi:hypothetical protein
MAFTLISSNTVSNTTTSSIVFSSIPQTYKLLYITGAFRTNRSAVTDFIDVRPNGATTNLLRYGGQNNLSATITLINTTTLQIPCPATNNNINSGFGPFTMWIGNYSSTSLVKPYLLSGGTVDTTATNGTIVQHVGGRWNVSGTAITSLEFIVGNGPYISQYSRVDLYGIS